MTESKATLRKRERYLKRRERNGLRRPRRVVVCMANVASVSFGPEKVREIYMNALNTPGPWGLPDFVGLCELSDLQINDTKAVKTLQMGSKGSPDSALGAVLRRPLVYFRSSKLIFGTDKTSEGGGIRKRPILLCEPVFGSGEPDGWSIRTKIGHPPPKRAPIARAKYLARFVAARGPLAMGDLNRLAIYIRRLFPGYRVHSSGLLHVIVPKYIPSKSAPVDIDSDHLALHVVTWY